MKRILVTGVGGSAGNNFIRSLRLAREKFHIVGTDADKFFIKLSRADENYVVPTCDSPDYIPMLNDIMKKERVDFLHCQPDTELQVLSEKRERVKAKMCLPSKRAIKCAFHKFVCNQTLQRASVPVPLAFYINSYKDIIHAIEVLESKGHKIYWVRAIKGAGSRGALPVYSYDEAKMWIGYWHNHKDVKYGQFMISEFLPGMEFAFQSIWKDGNLICSQARQRLAYVFGSRMPSGQSSSPTIAKTVHNDKVNNNAVAGILAIDSKPNGIYCVDLKCNKYNEPCITEINAGRFFTTSIFFTVAGCNMPYWYVRAGYNEKIIEVPKYNFLPPNLYWIRNIDMGEVLCRGISTD